jgi:hypothetical protein
MSMYSKEDKAKKTAKALKKGKKKTATDYLKMPEAEKAD